MELYTVKNTDGMTCFSSIYSSRMTTKLIGMDRWGETSVKAVWASIMSRKQITLGYRRTSAHRFFRSQQCEKKLCGNSLPLLRWHIVPLRGGTNCDLRLERADDT